MTRQMLKEAAANTGIYNLRPKDGNTETISGSTLLKEPPQERKWLLQNIVELGRTGLILGTGGTGKSMFALQLGVSVSTDIPVCQGLYDVAAAGPVLYLAAEDDRAEIQRRLHSIKNRIVRTSEDSLSEYKLSLETFSERLNALHIKPLTGHSVPFVRDNTATEFFEEILAEARSILDLRLIIIDPLRRYFIGDENDSNATTILITMAEKLSADTGATVLLVHHMNQGSAKAGGRDQFSGRGSTALTDSVRFQINMTPITKAECERLKVVHDEKNLYLNITITKNNYAPPQIQNTYLKREEGGVLRFFETDCKIHSDQQIMRMVSEMLQKEIENDVYLGKTEFVNKYGGRDKDFGLGRKRLTEIIDIAIRSGVLTQNTDPNQTGSGRKRNLLIPINS